MMRLFTVTLLLVLATVSLATASFHAWHRDFFWVRRVCHHPSARDGARLLRIARDVNYHDPRNTAYSMMLGEGLRRAGEKDFGLRVLYMQVVLHPDDPGILRSYADNLAEAGRRAEADMVYRQLLNRLKARNAPAAEAPPH